MQPLRDVENLRALTSLRFIAALMIVILHAQSQFTWANTPLRLPLVHGVSFFFVLSGFILTHVYSSKQVRLGSFLRARFARLWPVHVISILLLVALLPHYAVTLDGPGIFNKFVTLGFNLSLLHSIFPFLAYTFSWNAVSWSISTEFFFYLAFPLLVVNVKRSWHWKLLGAVALAAAVILLLYLLGLPIDSEDVNQATAVYATYSSPLVRGIEFCAGMGAWVLWDRHVRGARLPRVAWSALELASVAALAWWMRYGYWDLAPMLSPWVLLWFGPAGSLWPFALLIVVFATGRGILSRVLSIWPLVFLGEISFSVYMLHQVLMKFFVVRLEWPDVPPVLYASVLLGAATASYLLVEKPGQRLLRGSSIDPPVPAPSGVRLRKT